MGRINSRRKGATGEREFCDWLFKNFTEVIEKPKRNLLQVREGGADIICPPFMFEIKRTEKVNLTAFWFQVKKATIKYIESGADGCEFLIPVVAFRQNNKPWKFLIGAEYIGVETGFLEITERVFIKFAKQQFESFKK